MHRRISVLVASGFALLLGLGTLVSAVMMTGLRDTVAHAQASQASALEVRAAVRSLRADYLESSDAVARLMLDPSQGEALATKRRADASAERHLSSATAATRKAELLDILHRLSAQDRLLTNRFEDKLLAVAAVDARKAKRLYFSEYLPALKVNMELVDDALRTATEEVSDASRLTEAQAQRTFVLGWATLGLFLVVGIASGLALSRAVRTIAKRFEVAASAVADQRDRLQAVMTAMRDSLVVIDGAGLVTMVNEETCRLLGRARAELVGEPVDRFLLTSHGTDDAQTSYCARDGTRIPMSVSVATLRDHAGGAAGTVLVAHDMRDHLRMLAEVAGARDAALEGSRSKSEFLANMSHEIRTPMNAIIGYTDIVLDWEALPGEQREYLDRVRISAVNLLEIINDVLDISKVEAGKLTMERMPYSLRTVVHDVVRTLVLRAEEKGLALSVHVAADVPERVTGDPTRLRQVVLNLVSNAIKFTDRGEVRVSVDLEHDARGVLHFAVRDTGIGIPADKQAVVFQAFTQADGSMSRRFGGTGLGLTIAARLVEMMGGRIWVESTVGAGSVFHFTVATSPEPQGLAA